MDVVPMKSGYRSNTVFRFTNKLQILPPRINRHAVHRNRLALFSFSEIIRVALSLSTGGA